MKAIDFSELKAFKNLRKKMNLFKTSEELINNHPKVKDYLDFYKAFNNGSIEIDDIDIYNLSNTINLGINNTLILGKTRQNLVVYVKKQYVNLNESSHNKTESTYKFHIAYCKTIKEFVENGFKHRFTLSRNKTGIFEVIDYNIASNPAKLIGTFNKKMKVCRNCLSEINYKNFNSCSREIQDNIVNNFSLEEFFKEYDVNYIYIPDDIKNEYEIYETELLDTYTEDWQSISREFREVKNWRCDKCGKDMSDKKHNLHVHHLDRNKRNNSYSNLICLCKECHSNMPNHSHMKNHR